MSDRPQSFANHSAQPTTPFNVAFVLLLGNIFWAGWQIVTAPSAGSAVGFALAITLVIVLYVARRDAQIVQDRVIRLEMRLRLERLLPGRDLSFLTLPQVIALRFAGDGELPALVDRVQRGELTQPKAIKQAITAWQADWLRV